MQQKPKHFCSHKIIEKINKIIERKWSVGLHIILQGKNPLSQQNVFKDKHKADNLQYMYQ